MSKSTNNAGALGLLTSLFFLWGFMTVLNDVLIPHLKTVFVLSYTQSMLVQLAFFGAYFSGALIYYLISITYGDPINKIGYKQGIIIGLIISALGSALFYPATYVHAYWFYLLALYILGLGFTILQIAANPFIAIVGSPETASSRLNFTQGFNSLGTTLGPIIGGFLIFKYFAGNDAVKYPYLFFSLVMVLLAFFISRSDLPAFKNTDKIEKGLAVLRFPQLRYGILAIFFYVGAEVVIGSLLISFFGLDEIAGLSENEAKTYLSLYWGGAMIGRFAGAVMLNDSAMGFIKLRNIVISIFAGFFLVFTINYFGGDLTFTIAAPYFIFLLINMLAFLLGRAIPGRTLGIFSLVIIALLVMVITQTGQIAFWSIIAIGLFNSIMWPNIFTLSIDGLGKYTSQGSSLLVMAIVGGALIPVFQGLVADFLATAENKDAGLQTSFIVPLVSYVYLSFYGFWASKGKELSSDKL
jgi:FHS family L-fucose permease-like MFS transporter